MAAASTSNSPARWVVLPHYAFAALSFVVLSVLLLFSTDAFGGHYFNPKLLTLTHVTVLGWATMLIFGALYQLLPVLLDCRLYSEKLAIYTFGLLASGTVLLACAFWHFQVGALLQVAAILLFAAFLLFTINVFQTARKAPKWTIEADFIVTASLWLLVTGLVGVLMAFNFTYAFLPEQHVHYLQLHAHIGMAGWFLLLIIGVGSKLIPMFLLAHTENTKKLNWAYNFVNGGLVLFIFDHLFLHTVFVPLYAALVAAGVGLFLWFLYEAAQTRQRQDVDLGMKQTFVALALLLLPLVLVFVVSSKGSLPQELLSSLYLVYGLSVFLGFLSALILGQTFKTLPFIIWMHAYEDYVGRFKTPLPKDLYIHTLLRWQNLCYLAGFILLIMGVLLRMPPVILAGAICFTVTALLYATNVFRMLLHKAHNLKPFTYGNANA
ncbi:cytochrome C oxidase subunit I [Pontibacter liquoris]|uniref:cytochrome C oxidase subunit I n=1 Tax=Pontibacter liquoris TaxID=2905677 RepID=UPI001FA7351A|nr:cytochrome C oxidase subunit I [Pontibacter liquoris]